jgi:radical S-adenosyl methionine domain-containing protein 2
MPDSNKCNYNECTQSNILANLLPVSVNLVVTTRCNYNCRFCFGHYRQLKRPPKDDRILEIPKLLAEAGCQKLTLEGGEPFLFTQLLELLKEAKNAGLVTCIVTNGMLVTKEKITSLSPYLDWIALSIDSMDEATEIKLKRGQGEHISHCKKIAIWVHELGIRLKINSVITSLNFNHDLKNLINELKPDRWKAFQLLQIEGENVETTKDLTITDEEFRIFMKKNESIRTYKTDFICESQDDMKGSYIMLLPDGRFFSNHEGKYVFGKKTIFKSGVLEALKEVGWDKEKFFHRGGYYQWKGNKSSLKLNINSWLNIKQNIINFYKNYKFKFNMKITGDINEFLEKNILEEID